MDEEDRKMERMKEGERRGCSRETLELMSEQNRRVEKENVMFCELPRLKDKCETQKLTLFFFFFYKNAAQHSTL